MYTRDKPSGKVYARDITAINEAKKRCTLEINHDKSVYWRYNRKEGYQEEVNVKNKPEGKLNARDKPKGRFTPHINQRKLEHCR